MFKILQPVPRLYALRGLIMSRPKGSKNRCPSLKENNQPTVPDVESLGVLARKRKIRSTTIPLVKKDDISSGTDSVETATLPLEDVPAVKSLSESGTKIVKGFVNIQQSKYGYYTGGDIHDTPEHAKGVASKATVATIFVAFEVKA